MDFWKRVPMERICIDLAGPFPISVHGNNDALVVTDCFTKCVEIYLILNQEAETVASLHVDKVS